MKHSNQEAVSVKKASMHIFAGVMVMTIIYSIKETQQMARKLIIVNLKHEHHATIFDHIVNTQSVKKVKKIGLVCDK